MRESDGGDHWCGDMVAGIVIVINQPEMGAFAENCPSGPVWRQSAIRSQKGTSKTRKMKRRQENEQGKTNEKGAQDG